MWQEIFRKVQYCKLTLHRKLDMWLEAEVTLVKAVQNVQNVILQTMVNCIRVPCKYTIRNIPSWNQFYSPIWKKISFFPMDGTHDDPIVSNTYVCT